MDTRGNAVNGYFYMYAYAGKPLVDYEKSIFNVFVDSEKQEEIHFTSGDDYLVKCRQMMKEDKDICVSEVQLSSDFNQYDLFFLENIEIPGYLVSERGKIILEAAGITGIEFIAEPRLISE